ncbi:recombinase family protein [Celerinatantimonas sp. MCCC 1A17872]|uniref:recombinase family protein n=1 Tax=Celerinatantimonas sp. MCCC 1A17872 TaxID=3177514 RepID=UPI0038C97854
MEVGYIRYADGNSKDGKQLFGIKLDRVFEEISIQSVTDRNVWHNCKDFCRSGDTVHVNSIDRICHKDIGEALASIDELNSRGVNVVFHKEDLVFKADASSLQLAMIQLLTFIYDAERVLGNESKVKKIDVTKLVNSK